MPSPYEIQLTLQPPRIMGRRLQPFSLGHAHLLDIAESPFMRGGELSVDDLILAAWLLTFPTYAKARKATLKALSGRVPGDVRRWGRQAAKFDMNAEKASLAEYIEACTRPPRSAKKDGAKALATPTAATLSVLHRHYFHTPDSSVWDLPFLEAMLDVVTYHHARGWLEILDEKQAAYIDHVMERERARKEAAK